MKNEMLALPGYRLMEYLLVLQPHEDLTNKILQIKKYFAEKFDVPAAEWGKPQITLAKFTQLHMLEERLTNRLKMIAMAMPAFKIDLKDYAGFPTHSIYINIETKAGIQTLVKHIKTAQTLMKTKDHKPHFMDNFFITIARQLLPWQYEKGLLEFSNKHFTGKFIARHMLLLARPQGTGTYQVINKFEFMNMPVLTTQGQLFL